MDRGYASPELTKAVPTSVFNILLVLSSKNSGSFENLSFTCLEGVRKSVVGSWKRKAETTYGTSAVQTCRDASYGFSLRLMASDSAKTDMYSDIRTTVLSLLPF